MTPANPPSGGGDTLAPRPTTTTAVGAEKPAFKVFEKAQRAEPPIRQFQFQASDAELVELRRRIEATRWPERELVDDGAQGVQLELMQNLADYWVNEYDWRKCEARLNALSNLIT